MTAVAGESILSVEGLSVSFETEYGAMTAVRDLSLSVERGQTLGVVGESGSGKTSVFLAIMGLLRGTDASVSGRALLHGRDLVGMNDEELRQLRGNRIAMIFQDPMSSLHPLHTVGWQIAEAIQSHIDVSKLEARERAIAALSEVGLSNAARRSRQFPHELSGGMRQRVMIAMALALRPEIVLADEPTTALDVTVQAQILDLLEDLRTELGAAVVLITHDLAVVAERTTAACVMYGGRVVESGATDTLFRDPRHPYTAALLDAVPRHDRPRQDALESIRGTPPAPGDLPAGCAFHPRCPYARETCVERRPLLRAISGGRFSACHFAETFRASGEGVRG